MVWPLLVLLGCSAPADQAEDPIDPGGKADDPAACIGARLDSNGICRRPDGRFAPRDCCTEPLAQLAGLLASEGVLVMPAPGVEHGANEFSTEVRLIPVDPDQPASAVRPEIDDIAADFVSDDAGDGVYGLFAQPDTHWTLRSGFMDAPVRDDLIAGVATDRRAEVLALLDDADLVAVYTGLRAFDIGSEIVGRDLFFIHPFGGTQALVVIVRYTQS